jgi:hypothetical protein
MAGTIHTASGGQAGWKNEVVVTCLPAGTSKDGDGQDVFQHGNCAASLEPPCFSLRLSRLKQNFCHRVYDFDTECVRRRTNPEQGHVQQTTRGPRH